MADLSLDIGQLILKRLDQLEYKIDNTNSRLNEVDIAQKVYFEKITADGKDKEEKRKRDAEVAIDRRKKLKLSLL